MARLFLALALPDRLRERLGEEIERLKLSRAELSWVKPANLHVTLRFLGDVEDRALLDLHPLFARTFAACARLPLVARALGAFPDLERPRVVWSGIAGEAEADGLRLKEMRRGLDEELKHEGFPREKGAYEPHITLGRVRSPANLKQLVERMGPAMRREFGHFTVGEVTLFESELQPGGSEYHVLHTFPLRG